MSITLQTPGAMDHALHQLYGLMWQHWAIPDHEAEGSMAVVHAAWHL